MVIQSGCSNLARFLLSLISTIQPNLDPARCHILHWIGCFRFPLCESQFSSGTVVESLSARHPACDDSALMAADRGTMTALFVFEVLSPLIRMAIQLMIR